MRTFFRLTASFLVSAALSSPHAHASPPVPIAGSQTQDYSHLPTDQELRQRHCSTLGLMPDTDWDMIKYETKYIKEMLGLYAETLPQLENALDTQYIEINGKHPDDLSMREVIKLLLDHKRNADIQRYQLDDNACPRDIHIAAIKHRHVAVRRALKLPAHAPYGAVISRAFEKDYDAAHYSEPAKRLDGQWELRPYGYNERYAFLLSIGGTFHERNRLWMAVVDETETQYRAIEFIEKLSPNVLFSTIEEELKFKNFQPERPEECKIIPPEQREPIIPMGFGSDYKTALNPYPNPTALAPAPA